MPEWAEACLKTYPLGWKGFGLSMCLLMAGNETVLEVGWEGRGSPPRAPGRPRPACHPGHLSEGPLQGQRSTCLPPQGCREERLQQKRLCFPLDHSAGQRAGQGWGAACPTAQPQKPSAPHCGAMGRSAGAACPLPSLTASTSHLSVLTGLASHPSPQYGQSREGGHQVLPSAPAQPSALPTTSSLTQASSPPRKMVTFPPGPPATASPAPAPLPKSTPFPSGRVGGSVHKQGTRNTVP